MFAADKITRPTILVDEDRVRKNIEGMVQRARRANVNFRPHFKTHQSAEIGAWFRDYDVSAITVSSIEMAVYFARMGWHDITIAFPLNILQMDDVVNLAGEVNLHVQIDNRDVLILLAQRVSTPVGVWISVDVGDGREGRSYTDLEGIADLIKRIKKSKNMSLDGLIAHFGRTYTVQGRDAVVQVFEQSMNRLMKLKEDLHTSGLEINAISIGDTPSCSLVDNFMGATEIRPGNFVFYDISQLWIGSCIEDQIAAAVICPVVGIYPERETVAILGGAIHLSKEFLPGTGNTRVYGKIAPYVSDHWGKINEDMNLLSLYQEHGLIRASSQVCHQMRVGDLIAVLPVHICLAVSGLRRYRTNRGECFLVSVD